VHSAIRPFGLVGNNKATNWYLPAYPKKSSVA
jgi:hypothetical protein